MPPTLIADSVHQVEIAGKGQEFDLAAEAHEFDYGGSQVVVDLDVVFGVLGPWKIGFYDEMEHDLLVSHSISNSEEVIPGKALSVAAYLGQRPREDPDQPLTERLAELGIERTLAEETAWMMQIELLGQQSRYARGSSKWNIFNGSDDGGAKRLLSERAQAYIACFGDEADPAKANRIAMQIRDSPTFAIAYALAYQVARNVEFPEDYGITSPHPFNPGNDGTRGNMIRASQAGRELPDVPHMRVKLQNFYAAILREAAGQAK